MSFDASNDITSQFLEAEIAAAEQALQENERKQLLLDNGEHESSPVDTPSERLDRLQHATNDLLLAEQMARWTRQWEEEAAATSSSEASSLYPECRHCCTLGQQLLTHRRQQQDDGSSVASALEQQIYNQVYLPLYRDLCASLTRSFRTSLKEADYPSTDGCARLLDDFETTSTSETVVASCQWLVRLGSVHQELLRHVPGSEPCLSAFTRVVAELLRPIVERVRFHFLTPDDSRPASSRIDRLPEWLFGYLRKHMFEEGAWDLISDMATVPNAIDYASVNTDDAEDEVPSSLLVDLPLHVLNELVRLIQYVLGERNFFRHPKITGPDSNPLLLCSAVEQLLLFDDFLKDQLQVTHHRQLLRLMDVFVAGDDELLQWWLQRENEAVFATLFDDSKPLEPLVYRISPRAELFCALLRSVRTKAALFTFSGPYWNAVASPLCVAFVDAVHESAVDLQRQLGSRGTSMDDIEIVITEWIKLGNGTHMATLTLQSPNEGVAKEDEGSLDFEVMQQVDRFGRSLQNLEQVLLDDFAGVLVETLLVERAKFASYLMRCPSLLLEDGVVGRLADGNTIPSSPELRGTMQVLSRIVRVCDNDDDAVGPHYSRVPLDQEDDSDDGARELALRAPRLLRDRVLSLVSDKLMDFALNLQGMTPELCFYGSTLFAKDVEGLFASAVTLPPDTLRLLDIVKLMKMDTSQLAGIGNALCGLAGQPGPLSEDVFATDGRLYDEAVSMVRAKGLAWINLDDVLAILNRRRDLI